MLSILEVIIRILLIVATSSVFGIVLLTYLRIRHTRMLLISIGFGFIVLYALTAIPEIFQQPVIIDENIHLSLHLVSLLFILIGILKD
jgi:hypothetical protein